MARLESQAKLGFYATPPHVVEHIKALLKIEKGARLLDTCCGEGEALSIVAKDSECKTFGVELDEERAKEAKKALDNVLNCDALVEMRVTNDSFGLLWLNPPYDIEMGSEEDDRDRLEVKFLRYHWRFLQKNGVLVYIIPFISLRKARGLLVRLGDLKVFSFPPDDFQTYKQVVVMGVKGEITPEERKANYKMLKELDDLPIPEVPEVLVTTDRGASARKIVSDAFYTVPSAPRKENFRFKTSRLNPEEAAAIVEKSPLFSEFERETKVKDIDNIRLLTSLRQGHLAILLASGLMNGEVEKDEKRFIIKGSVRKVQDVEKEYEEDRVKTITRDRYEIVVKALDYSEKRFIEIK